MPGMMASGVFPANHVSLLEPSPSASSAIADGSEPVLQQDMPTFEAESEEAVSERISEAAREMIGKAASSLARLRSVLDSHVVGQPHVKEGILLALMTREHVYLEGPPGVAKTYTAEITAKAT